MKIAQTRLLLIVILALSATTLVFSKSKDDDDEPEPIRYQTILEDAISGAEDAEYFFDEDDQEAAAPEYHAKVTEQTVFPYNFRLQGDYEEEFFEVERDRLFSLEVPVWAAPGEKYEDEEQAQEAFEEMLKEYDEAAVGRSLIKQWHLLNFDTYSDLTFDTLGFFAASEEEGEGDDILDGKFVWEFKATRIGIYDLYFVYAHQDQLNDLRREFKNDGDASLHSMRFRKATIHALVTEEDEYIEFLDNESEELYADIPDEFGNIPDQIADEDREFYRYRKGDVTELSQEELRLWDEHLNLAEQDSHVKDDF